MATTEEAAENTGGFQIPKEDSKTRDKLEDFNRYAGKKAWELAFRTMNSLLETEGTGMVPVNEGLQPGDGFFLPLRRRIALSLVGLPAEGRDAYRLFYDAEAKALWSKVKEGKATGAEELRAEEMGCRRS